MEAMCTWLQIHVKKSITFISKNTFKTILFHFPHVGSRNPKYGRNPNHHLLVRFLRSASYCLKSYGEIAITIVGSPHYDGAFDVEGAAKKAGYKNPLCYRYNPEGFDDYLHTNTNNNHSAISKFNDFETWVFQRNKHVLL